jgi:hypothetical protein
MANQSTSNHHQREDIIQVVHQLPHRIRIRISQAGRKEKYLSKAKELLQTVPGVHNVEVNSKTGSLLVQHDPGAFSAATLENALNSIARIFAELFPLTELTDDSGISQISDSVYSFIGVADDKLSNWSNNTIDLKTVVPLILAYIGLRKISETKSILGEISPIVLLYYAFDTYYKFHRKSYYIETATSNGHKIGKDQ